MSLYIVSLVVILSNWVSDKLGLPVPKFRAFQDLWCGRPWPKGFLKNVVQKIVGINLLVPSGYLRKSLLTPQITRNHPKPQISRESGVAPKSPSNSHWIHTKRHTKPHWIPLNSPEFSRNFLKFPRIRPNSTEFLKFPGNQGRRGIHTSSQFLGEGAAPSHGTSPCSTLASRPSSTLKFRSALFSTLPSHFSAGSIHHVMWSFPAKIWPKNAENDHITWRPWAFKTSTFGITWCDNFWPNLRFKSRNVFHIRWRMLAAQFFGFPCVSIL